MPEIIIRRPGEKKKEEPEIIIRRPKEQAEDVVIRRPGQPPPIISKGLSKAKEFFWTRPEQSAQVLREAITEKIGPSVEEIETQAAETGKIPYGKIAGRTAAETLSEMIPMTPLDVAMFGAAGAAGKGVGALGRKFPVVGRVMKTPIQHLGRRFEAIKRARMGPKPPVPELIKPVVQPGRPQPLIRPGEVTPPAEPPKLIKPGQEHMAPSTQKNMLGPIDKTKPLPAQMMDAKKLTRPPANAIEPITPVEGPTVLAETQPVKEGVSMAIQRDFIDRFTPIKGIPQKGIAPEFEQAGGGYSKAYVDARLMKGKIGGKSELILDEVNDIVQPLKNYNDRVLLNEIYSLKNFRDLDMIGRTTSNITVRDANKALAAIRKRIGSENYARINKVADDLANLQNNKGLDILVEAKIITPDTKAALIKRYPNYLRSEILDENLAPQFGGFVASSGEPIGRINRSFLKTKLGTTKMINTDVLDVIRRSLISKIAAAEKQKVVDQVAREFGVPIGRRYLGKPKVLKTKAGFEIKGPRAEKRTLDQRQIVERFREKDIPPGWVRSSVKTTDGKIVAIHPEVERMLQGLNTVEADIMTRMMGHYNNVFRLGATTYRLPFVINNIKRDLQNLLFNKRVLPGQKTAPVAYLEGAISAIKNGFGVKDEVMKSFLDEGAAFGGIVSSKLGTIKVPFRLRTPTEKFKDIVARPILFPFQEIERLATISENAARLAEFIRLRGTNLPKELKALNARDITVDFEKMGDSMKLFNRMIPFLNAQMQGELNTLRAFRAQPLTAIGRVGYLITLPVVGMYAWNRKFKNNDRIDPYIKENYFYLNSGIEIEREGQKVPVILAARKGDAAKWFAYPLEAFLEWSENDPNFKERMEEVNLKNLGSSLVSRLTPPAISGVAEQLANYDFFRRRPIVPMRLQDVESGKQFKTYTSDTARLIGEKTGISPVRLEHGARSIFPASPQIFEAADVGLKSAGIQPEIPRKPQEGLRRFEAMFPTVRAPSGYYSPEKSEARRFEEKERKEARTPKFMFEEAYRRFVENPSAENRMRFIEWSRKVQGKDRARIMKKVQQENLLSRMPMREQAVRRLPRGMQPKFRRLLTEER